MIPKECKRLAEVDFPIAVVSKHSAREKSIRHGHPSTLHLWWARRPLAACRSMLLALLLPGPCDPHCPAEFKKKARALLTKTQGQVDADDMGLRKGILGFIGDFANWDNSSHPTYLEVGRGLVKAAHPEETPLVVDPFAGGGSIPVEALRLGCDAFASDLNPVACLINKVMLEDIPRYGNADFTLKDDEGKDMAVHGLANALRHVGAQIKKAAEKELAEFYPPDPDGARPIAYLWSRTVRCESPKCGAEIPLVRSFWLCKKTARKRALRFTKLAKTMHGMEPKFEVFEPKTEKDVPAGTVARAKATCLNCGTVMHPDRVRAQLAAQSGGADVIFDGKGTRIGGARLLAVVTISDSQDGRCYRLSTDRDYAAVHRAQRAIHRLPKGAIPDEVIPNTELRRIAIPIYGVTHWADMFTARQKIGMVTLSRLARDTMHDTSPLAMTDRFLALAVSRFLDISNAFCQWETSKTQVRHLFTRQAIPMLWDFAEADFLGGNAGDFATTLETMIRVADRCLCLASTAQVDMADAAQHPLPNASAPIWFTDPPYYDSVPYGHLSDFFYVWLRRLVNQRDHWFKSSVTDKSAECVVDRAHSLSDSTKTPAFYESKMADGMCEGRRVVRDDGMGCVVFAHKTTEGWEALLSGILRAGWTITASWPIETELKNKVSGLQSGEKKAMLLASVHLVCRPRGEDSPIGDWGAVLQELPERVGNWIERLQDEGVRGADLVFACIGPALEIYSRYSKVEDAEGRVIPLGGNPEAVEPHRRGFLAYVWETVGRIALQTILGTAEAKARNGAAGALEEDARLTALFLWTIQSSNGKAATDGVAAEEEEEGEETADGEEARAAKKAKGYSLIYDVARRFAQPLGIHLDAWEGRIIETDKGMVRLLSVVERAEQLFGQAGASLAGDRIEEQAKRKQQASFDFMVQAEAAAVPEIHGRARRGSTASKVPDESLRSRREATTLDRVHAAMLLQAAGKSNALRALLKAEVDRSPDFLRLANALSALYPTGSDEKRLVDAMLLAVPR